MCLLMALIDGEEPECPYLRLDSLAWYSQSQIQSFYKEYIKNVIKEA